MLLHPIFLLSVLLNVTPSLSYSLRNCSIEYSEYVWEVSVICNSRGFASVPDDIPENTTSLSLNNNQIVTVNRTYFSGLSKLLDLALEMNSVSYIDDRAFEDLVCLRDLSLSTNSITMLSDDMFKGLSKLENLSLDKNKLQYISPKAFQPLNSLKKVILAYNHLQEMSVIVGILQLPNIHELHAGLNRFTSFDTDDMPFNKSNLRILWFNGNPLKKFRITRDVFGHLESLDMSNCSPGFEWYVSDKNYLRSLKTLYLSGTEVSFEMYKRIFQSTFALEYVWPSDTTEYLGNGLLDFICQIPSLATLDLNCNDIHDLNDTLLQPCSKITELILNGNVMTSLSENSLRPLNQLQSLSLSYNFLTTVPTAIRGLSKLKSLGLESNDIGELRCGDFLNLTSLMRLTLFKNRISVMRGCAFQDLSELTYLNMDSNPIIRLGDTFRVSLRKLYILKMSMNQIVQFDEGDFKGLPSLLVLQIQSGMVCQEKNGTFYGLHNLTTLVLAAYSLDKDIFRGMPNLKNLTVYLPILENNLSIEINNDPPPFLFLPFLKVLSIYNSNAFTVVISPNLLCGLQYLEQFASDNFFMGTPHPDTFTYTPRLKSLRITNSYVLNPEPELLQPLTNLQALDLSNNKLRSLDFLTKANLSSLRWLKLTDNEFTFVDETVLQSLPALSYLDLSGNPFACNCLNSGFIQWVKSTNQTQVVNAYQYDCYFPPSKQGTNLMDFDIQSCRIDISFLCYISSSCLVMLTLLTSFIYHFLRWQMVYAFLLFQAFLYDSRKRRRGAPHLYDAFISYNVEDEAWVYREMLPVLEGEQGWRLCLHHRDFLPGTPIMENIVDAIYRSRKTICVISRSYLQSEWCSKEFQMASFRLFDEKKDVLILLFLEEIPDQQLSPYYRMRKLVKKRTYLSWPKAGQHTGLFWQSVQRALQTGYAPTDGRNILTAGLAPEN